MIAEASKRFPGACLEVCDARNLSKFPDGSFDLVMFSFNGIDCLSHHGRMQAMNEIKRVLKSDGIFAFSSHNRDRPVASPYSLSNINISKNPLAMVRNLHRFYRGICNWHRSRYLTEETDEFAMRQDSGNVFEVPMYYISKSEQLKQLNRLGFRLQNIYDRQGNKTRTDLLDFVSSWIFYVAVT
jgi:ubiquinone/menaquinone biosynthesis C-methylase UbiE